MVLDLRARGGDLHLHLFDGSVQAIAAIVDVAGQRSRGPLGTTRNRAGHGFDKAHLFPQLLAKTDQPGELLLFFMKLTAASFQETWLCLAHAKSIPPVAALAVD